LICRNINIASLFLIKNICIKPKTLNLNLEENSRSPSFPKNSLFKLQTLTFLTNTTQHKQPHTNNNSRNMSQTTSMMPIPERRRCSSAPSLAKHGLSSALKLLSMEEPILQSSQQMNHVAHSICIEEINNEDKNKDKEGNGTEAVQAQEVQSQEQQQAMQISTPTQRHRPSVSEALQLSIAAITHEVTVVLPVTAAIFAGKCSVCLSPDADLVYTCKEDVTSNPSPPAAAATTAACEGALCLDCIKGLVQNTIHNSLYSVPGIRCPGRCFCNIPTAVWRGLLVGEEAAAGAEREGGERKGSDEQDLEQTLMKR
jgi:hypothetical protein